MKKLFLSTAAAVVALGVAGASAQTGGGQGQPPVMPKQGEQKAPGSGGGSMEQPQRQPSQQGEQGTRPSQKQGEEGTMPRKQQQGEDETTPRRQQQGEEETSPRKQQQGEDETTPRRQQQGEDETMPGKQKQGEDETTPRKQQQGRDADKKDEATGSVEIDSRQKTEIRSKVNIKQYEVSNPTFVVSVGTVIPRTVELHPVPATLVEIVPAWRAYRIIVVGGDLIIIDPDTYRIITVVQL